MATAPNARIAQYSSVRFLVTNALIERPTGVAGLLCYCGRMIELSVPIVLAPMAGGPSTPEFVAAVSNAGGFGFLAAGYKTPEAVSADIAATRALTVRPFGVNVFAPSGSPANPAAVRRYAHRLADWAQQCGVALGEPRFDDDWYEAKLALLEHERPAVVSFTFGCPSSDAISRLHTVDVTVWVTVTDASEASQAVAAGADGLVVQGIEAGGHRGSFVDYDGKEDFGLLTLIALVRARVDVPLIAAGGIATGPTVAGVLAAGATAAAVGTAFLRCPEAGTSMVHRDALARPRPTALTRVFTGRLARGMVNRWHEEHAADAPIAYPEVHHLTSPLRAHARTSNDPEFVNLWAGQAHELVEAIPAAQLVVELARDAHTALEKARTRIASI